MIDYDLTAFLFKTCRWDVLLSVSEDVHRSQEWEVLYICQLLCDRRQGEVSFVSHKKHFLLFHGIIH